MLSRKTEYSNYLAAEIESAKTYACDVTDPIAVETAFSAVRTDMGEIDILVYNAGSGVWGNIEELNDFLPAVWDTEPGFGLRFAPSGRKSFIYLYRFEGRPRRFTLGVYPRMPLADAREALAKAAKMLDKGIEPAEQELAARKDRRDAD